MYENTSINVFIFIKILITKLYFSNQDVKEIEVTILKDCLEVYAKIDWTIFRGLGRSEC